MPHGRIEIDKKRYKSCELCITACPTNWGMTPTEAMNWIRDHMIPAYPLGDYKVADELKGKSRREGSKISK